MSTLTDELAPISSLLTAASGPAGAVTAVANLLTEIGKIAEPILANDEVQSYEAAKKARIQKAAELVSELLAHPDDVGAQQRLNAFDDQLCLDSGFPLAGGVAEPTITIRVSRYLAHAAIASGKICDDAYLTSLVQNSVKGQPAPKAS
jgi:hypothetical protein